MSVTTLPGRAVRSIRHHGVRHTWDTATYRFKKATAMRAYRRWVERANLLERAALRQQADLTVPTATTDMPTKGPSGFPGSCPQMRYEPGDRFVATLSDARVIGRRGLVLDPSGRFVVEPVGPPVIVPRRPALAIQGAVQSLGLRRTRAYLRGDRPTQRLANPVAHLIPPFRNYYHWFVECIPRLRLLERWGERNGVYPTLLVPEDRTNWMDAILDASGYPGRFRRAGHEAILAHELVVPTFPDPVREDLTWLRERFHPGGSGPGRVLVTREDTGHRVLSNRSDVIAALADRGFAVVCPGRHSIAEQARLFGDADIIVGVHGAGLANVLWPTDGTLIELTGEKAIATYARLAELCDHDYHRLDCAADPYGDVVADVDALCEVIDGI